MWPVILGPSMMWALILGFSLGKGGVLKTLFSLRCLEGLSEREPLLKCQRKICINQCDWALLILDALKKNYTCKLMLLFWSGAGGGKIDAFSKNLLLLIIIIKNLLFSFNLHISHYLLDTPMNEVSALQSPSGAMLQGRNKLPNWKTLPFSLA